jgi:hypothetical protein
VDEGEARFEHEPAQVLGLLTFLVAFCLCSREKFGRLPLLAVELELFVVARDALRKEPIGLDDAGRLKGVLAVGIFLASQLWWWSLARALLAAFCFRSWKELDLFPVQARALEGVVVA